MEAMKAAAPAKSMKVAKKATMKTMKAMKAMKIVSKIAKGRLAKYLVFRGSKEKTAGGLTKDRLELNSKGRVVNRNRVAQGKASPWIHACLLARSSLGLKGFVAIKKGTPVYKKAKEFHEKMAQPVPRSFGFKAMKAMKALA